MSKKKIRITTNQPGVYLNQENGKYDVKYSYTEYDPISGEKKYKAKWVYGINSYKTAVSVLSGMKIQKKISGNEEITLGQALELWMNKANANHYSQACIKNTKQQYNMITKFWSPEAKLKYITEDGVWKTFEKRNAACGFWV